MKKELDLSYVNCRDLLESTGIQRISVSGSEITFSCFTDNHLHGDVRPSARMNSKTTLWYCAGCSSRGNAIQFLSQHKKIPETEARRLLEERYGGELSAPIEDLTKEVEEIMRDNEKVIDTRRYPSESWIDNFRVDWEQTAVQLKALLRVKEYITQRGFSTSSLNQWELGWEPFQERITIPIRDHTGKLIGFKGRKILDNDPYPKYLILGDKAGAIPKYGFDCYRKSEYVFGLNKLASEYMIDEVMEINPVLVEGELNVISMYQKGFLGALGVAGSEFSETQRDLIIKFCKSIIIFFDNDESGRKGTKKVVDMLSPHMDVRVILNAPGDAAELSKEEIIHLISSAEPALLLQCRGDL